MKIERYHLSVIDSTNNWVKTHIDEFDPRVLTLVTADEQTAGRGRLKRQWISPSKVNFYGTFAFFSDKAQSNISQLMAISAVEVLRELGFEVKCKWPNDLILGNKKVGGILCETFHGRHGLGVAVGIGINVNMPKQLLEGIDQPATSLLVEGGAEQPIQWIIDSLAKQFNEDLDLFSRKGFTPFFERYRQMLIHQPEQTIRFHDNQITWEGLFHNLNPDGSISILISSGELKTFFSGEVV